MERPEVVIMIDGEEEHRYNYHHGMLIPREGETVILGKYGKAGRVFDVSWYLLPIEPFNEQLTISCYSSWKRLSNGVVVRDGTV